MKKLIIAIIALNLCFLTSCKTEPKNDKEEVTVMNEVAQEVSDVELNDVAVIEATFGVRGNCGMCKSTIEKAAKSVDGVKKANWDVDSKVITVSYNNDKTNTDAVQKAIAASGYDTSDFKGDDVAYKSNAKCCQYDRSMEIK
jgi:mercuric ion binding protein